MYGNMAQFATWQHQQAGALEQASSRAVSFLVEVWQAESAEPSQSEHCLAMWPSHWPDFSLDCRFANALFSIACIARIADY